MKTTLVLFSALLLLALVECGTGVPTSPAAPPTAIMTPTRTYAFAIHLLADNVPPEQLAILSHLELESEPILTIDDIVTYDKSSHEIELTAAGYERIHGFQVPTSGRAFAVSVNGEPIYTGAFWTLLSSQSFDGIVILVDPIEVAKEPTVQIQLGYPGPDFFRGDDPRSDPRVLQALGQAGKLRW